MDIIVPTIIFIGGFSVSIFITVEYIAKPGQTVDEYMMFPMIGTLAFFMIAAKTHELCYPDSPDVNEAARAADAELRRNLVWQKAGSGHIAPTRGNKEHSE